MKLYRCTAVFMAPCTVVLSLAWLALGAYAPHRLIALPNPASISDARARLHARVEGYGQAMQQGDWAKVTEFVHPSQREAYRRVKKTRALSYKIDKITLEEDRKHAQVSMTITKPAFGAPPIDIKVHNTWTWIDGEWFIFFRRGGRANSRDASPQKSN